ncbi:hypothetical protein D3C76_1388660 [compost metagenome]
MVAGREGNHASLALRRAQLSNRIVRATKLEGAYTLEVFALEEQLRPGDVVGLLRGHDRCAQGMSCQDFGGGRDIGGGDAVGR